MKRRFLTFMKIILVVTLLFSLLSCKKTKEEIRKEYEKCLKSSNSYERYKCHYDLDGDKIVLKDGVKLTFKELKSIFDQMFFGRSPLAYKNKVWRTINVEDGIPFNIDIRAEDENVDKKLAINFLRMFKKKSNIFILLNRNITIIDNENKYKNILFLFASDNKNLLRSYGDVAKDVGMNTNDITQGKSRVINFLKNKEDVDKRLLSVFFFSISYPLYITDYAFNHITVNKNLSEKTLGLTSYYTLFSLYGMFARYHIDRPDVISYFNEQLGFAPLEDVVYIDFLVMTLWNHQSIKAGISKEDFFKELKKMIYEK